MIVRVIMIRCPICGMRIENAKRHLRKYHGLSLPDEEFARSILTLYRIFRRRDEFVPLVPLHEWEYEDFLKVMTVLGDAKISLKRKLRLFEPLAKFFARRFSTRILEEFPRLVREGSKPIRALAFIALTFVPSEDAVSTIIELCDRRKSFFLEYIVGLFQRYKDSVPMRVKRSIDGGKLLSPSCVLKAVFMVSPENIYDLVSYLYQHTPVEMKEKLIEEFVELFDYMVSFPKRYLSSKPVRKTLLLLAKAKFFGNLEADVADEKLFRMIKQYTILTSLDDLWSRRYYSCQRRMGRNIYNQMKNMVPPNTLFGRIILRICEALDNYPEARTRIGEIAVDEYVEALEDLDGEYVRGLFLYIMADISLKNGYPDISLALIEKMEKIIRRNYDYVPHALLIKALAQEFLGLYDEALKTHEKLGKLKARWEKALLDRARLYTILQQYKEAEKALLQVKTNVIYKLVLEAVIVHITGKSERTEDLIGRISRYTSLSDPNKAFSLLRAMEYICYCLYRKAIDIVWNDYDLRRVFFDILMLACPRHQKYVILEANRMHPKDPLISYYLGVVAIEENRYKEALRFLDMAENIDRRILLVNKLLAAMMAQKKDIAEQIYLELKELPETDEVKELAMIHYLMYSKRFPEAHNRLNRIRDLLDYEIYLQLKRNILQKRFTIDNYIYYVASREIGEAICPLLSIPIA